MLVEIEDCVVNRYACHISYVKTTSLRTTGVFRVWQKCQRQSTSGSQNGGTVSL